MKHVANDDTMQEGMNCSAIEKVMQSSQRRGKLPTHSYKGLYTDDGLFVAIPRQLKFDAIEY